MTKRLGIAAALCAILAACGGSGSGGNAAVDKKFTYGTPTASTTETTAASSHLTGALTLKSAPTGSDAAGMADVAGLASALMGSSDSGINYLQAGDLAQQAVRSTLLRAARGQLSPALTVAFDETCVTSTATSLTFKGCTVTVSDTSASGTVSFDGSFTVTGQTLTWDLTIHGAITVTSSSTTVTVNLNFHESGSIAVTDTTIVGNLLAELHVDASGGGESASLGVSYAVNANLTYQSTPFCVTSGTLEAKRVWTDCGGESEAQLPDKGVLVTWTACGTGTVAFSTN